MNYSDIAATIRELDLLYCETMKRGNADDNGALIWHTIILLREMAREYLNQSAELTEARHRILVQLETIVQLEKERGE